MRRIRIFLKSGVVVPLIAFALTTSLLSWAINPASTTGFLNGDSRADPPIQAATPPKHKKRKAKQKTMIKKLIAVPPGIWGTDHIMLNVATSGVTIEHDCADGQIEQSLMIDESGNFSAIGVHVARQAGPIRIDDKQTRQPALYVGKISGDTMTLKITLTETKQVIGQFTLKRGTIPEMTRCY
jgi:hypothetical protein